MSYALTRLALRRSARAEARRRSALVAHDEHASLVDDMLEELELAVGRTHDAALPDQGAVSVPACDAAGAPDPCDRSGEGAPADMAVMAIGPIGSAMAGKPPRFPEFRAKAGVDVSVPMDLADAEPVSRAGRATALPVEKFGEIRKAPKVDYTRVAAAHRAVGHGGGHAAMAEPKILEPALSREECPRCGIPGFKGCAHQAPFEGGPPPEIKAVVDRRAANGQNWRKGFRP